VSEKPEQTPREIITKLAAMSDAEFNAFMSRHFAQKCNQPSPKGSAEHE
jgi:hypothetical protein